MSDWILTGTVSPETLEEMLRAIGAERYHNQHPHHARMRDGGLSKSEMQAWALNRYLYQSRIPIKDAAIMKRMIDPALRRIWRQRIIDHDGEGADEGGVERWLKLTDGLGLDRDYVVSEAGILPATRFAVDAYIQFVSEKSLLEAIASSLTELFAPTIIEDRVAGILRNYDFISAETLSYFDYRMTQAPRDATFALDYVKQHAQSVEDQQKVLNALLFKTGMLWAQLDALDYAYAGKGQIPPGAFNPAEQG